MKIATRALTALTEHLPLKIESIQCNDPILVLIGMDWSIALMAPWRILLDGKMIAWGDKPDPAQLEPLLSGNAIIGCDFQGKYSQLDPVLVLDSGHVFEIFSSSPLEPWIVQLDGNRTYVAEPSE